MNESYKNSNASLILTMENVYKSYPVRGGEDKLVLNNINLSVSKGSFISVVGPTGCGKSTMFRLLLGEEPPTSGIVKVNGKIVTKPDRNRGVVFQKYSLFPHLNVIENVSYGLELEEFTISGRYLNPLKYSVKKKLYREQAMSYLESVGLGESANKFPTELSGGMRQRAAIAQALIMNPEILFMDEPFGALDEGTRLDMQLFLLQLWEKTNMTVFFVTHDLEEALYMGTRVLVLSQYYSSNDGPAKGSKFVIDKSIPGKSPRPSESRYTQEFNKLLAQIRKDGLDPDYKQDIKDFDLSHRLALKGI
jgi:NitT/TauT family transport system ATP-binding protein